ncbi:SpoIIE family protein phosphatase [Pseudodesulfovibrio sp. F-1]|uniref:SpoIIE family protein phosphatase n=1 Tax=Pseudodesulfovibrio alkaliphilus TaxID=2661613 RepID=A0A7K1KMG3_9BACT|nr:SpoIIE family protein phosphatase [Pseudodesulfovibrio alkaliphilus]MUM77207.1 SpoIIE family protein phosphatase [Pseudodesulfovibrio alkaliphilus]
MSPRAATYFLLAMAGGAFFGGQTCPLIEGLAAPLLWLLLLLPLALAMLVRSLALPPLLSRRPPALRARLQLVVDLGLFAAAALVTAVALRLTFGFGLLESGLKLALGVFAIGVFASLDLALERERETIRLAKPGRSFTREQSPPCRVVSIASQFILVTTAVVSLAAAVLLVMLLGDIRWLSEQGLSPASLPFLGPAVLGEILLVMAALLALIVNLAVSYSRNLRLLFANQTAVLEAVSRGDLSRNVPAVTCDEMGVIAAHTNAMIASLRDGQRLRDGLRIAVEVQQNLLPDQAPALPGLDLAGAAVFSEETGGDFFDYIGCDDEVCGRVAVAVGDVSGHGIGAALLMAAGRALVRQSAASPGSPARNITTANRHLTRDIDDTGRFMTLFFVVLDPAAREATWVNAGHQPPLLHDPADNSFRELRGRDIPLGVDREWRFHQETMPLPGPGQTMLIGTDGLWEAQNRQGDMFGHERVRQVLRDNSGADARQLVSALLAAVADFAGATPQDDDITLVVVKGV